MNIPQVISVVVVILVILVMFVVAAVRPKQKMYESIIQGMWKGGDDFLEKAELGGMYLYIGTPYNSGASSMTKELRKAYLIMHNEDAVLVNKRIDIEITKPLLSNINPFVELELEREIKIKEFSGEEDALKLNTSGLLNDQDNDSTIPISDIMPETQTMYLDLGAGRIALKGIDESGEEQVYAELFKDAAASVDFTE